MKTAFIVFGGVIVAVFAAGGVFAAFYHGWTPITGYLTGKSGLVVKLDELKEDVRKISEKLDALQKTQAEANKK